MKVQTFIGKISTDGLATMDHHISEWLERTKARPIEITQCCGTERHHDGSQQEAVLLTSVWYEEND